MTHYKAPSILRQVIFKYHIQYSFDKWQAGYRVNNIEFAHGNFKKTHHVYLNSQESFIAHQVSTLVCPSSICFKRCTEIFWSPPDLRDETC